MPEDSSSKKTTDEYFAEYWRRVEQGDSINRDEFLEDAQDASEVGELLEMVELIEEMAGPTVEEGDKDPTWQDDDTLPGEDSVQSAELAFPLPFQIGDYELREQIGHGGMGIVFKAWQNSMAREVAVKMILAGRLASTEDRARFKIEAQAAGRLDHPNIVSIYSVHYVDGHDFYAMELVTGSSLNEFLEDDNRFESKTAARYVRDIANAIHTAHQRGLIHRDIKPHNVMVTEKDSIRILDFGLSKEMDDNSSLTGIGDAVGTPSYMAPEQVTKGSDTPAADIYSIGALLYALLTGRPPFRGKTPLDTLLSAMGSEPVPVSELNSKVDKDLETICLKCLEKEPANRYDTAEELADDLDRYLNGEAISASRPSWLSGQVRKVRATKISLVTFVVSVVVLAILGFGLFVFNESRKPLELKIASGEALGAYYDFGSKLAKAIEADWEQVQHVENDETQGSSENVDLVRNSTTMLGLAQRDVLSTTGGVRVLAPLFEDVVCIVTPSSTKSLAELNQGHVSIGLEKSGMRISGRRIISFLKRQDINLREKLVPFHELGKDTDLVAAIVTSRLDNQRFELSFSNRDYVLHSIPKAKELAQSDPMFSEHTIRPGDLKSWKLGANIQTVKTTTFLICHPRMADKVVRRVLQIIYVNSDLVSSGKLIAINKAKLDGLTLHPEAQRFFNELMAKK